MKRSVGEARLYLVSTSRMAAGDLVDLVPELAAAGVDLIQLREKELEAGDVIRVGEPIADACRAVGIPFIVNDRPDLVAALNADGVHLGTNDLPTRFARDLIGDRIVGRSTHSEADIVQTLEEQDPDYIAVGPVYETPTKPGRPAVGMDLVRYAAERVGIPWFAIGGIDESHLDAVLEAGARRIVVVRVITEASDPVAVAARLYEKLRAAPL